MLCTFLDPHQKHIQGIRTTNYFTITLHVLSPAAVFVFPAHLVTSFKCTLLYFAITNSKWNTSNRFTYRGTKTKA